MAILYFLAEEPVKDDQRQDCCLIVKVHAPDGIDDELVQLAAGEAIEDKFGKRFTLWLADQEEASQYLQTDLGATNGWLKLGTDVPLSWHLLRIV